MGRPRLVVRPVEVHVNVPEDVLARIDLLLFSPSQGRVPVGRRAAFIVQALREKLERVQAAQQAGEYHDS